MLQGSHATSLTFSKLSIPWKPKMLGGLSRCKNVDTFGRCPLTGRREHQGLSVLKLPWSFTSVDQSPFASSFYVNIPAPQAASLALVLICMSHLSLWLLRHRNQRLRRFLSRWMNGTACTSFYPCLPSSTSQARRCSSSRPLSRRVCEPSIPVCSSSTFIQFVWYHLQLGVHSLLLLIRRNHQWWPVLLHPNYPVHPPNNMPPPAFILERRIPSSDGSPPPRPSSPPPPGLIQRATTPLGSILSVSGVKVVYSLCRHGSSSPLFLSYLKLLMFKISAICSPWSIFYLGLIISHSGRSHRHLHQQTHNPNPNHHLHLLRGHSESRTGVLNLMKVRVQGSFRGDELKMESSNSSRGGLRNHRYPSWNNHKLYKMIPFFFFLIIASVLFIFFSFSF